MIANIIRQVEHRPWPLPNQPWVMRQTWHDLLFMHWPVPIETLRVLVPDSLTVETFEGSAWIGVVPFGMRDVAPRAITAVPWLSAFPELNVRTYVSARDAGEPKPGAYFFSLDAGNPVAVSLARRFFHLPYYRADMSLTPVGKTIRYASHRTHRPAPAAMFDAQYTPTGPVFAARPGTLEHWLTERYCLYTHNRRGRLLRGEIHHLPWPLQPADVTIVENQMAEAAGIEIPDTPPLTHFAASIDVAVWPLTLVTPTT